MRIFNLRNIQYNQILADISRYLQKVSGNQKIINNSTIFGQLMTVVAGIAHNIMLYIEDALTEQNKYTAQRKKSVYGLAVQSGYQPSYGKAAGVWVRISHKPNNRNPLDVIIPDHQRIICAQNGLYYNLILNKDAMVLKCDVNMSNNYFYAVQGHFETQKFVVPGGSLFVQNFKFAGYLDTDYIRVYVNGQEWEQVASLYDMGPNQKCFAVRFSPTVGCDILFGNGSHGKVLQEGDVLEIQYLLHDGESGNLNVQENSFFIFGKLLRDVSGETVDGNGCFDIKFATNDAIAAGANPETITQTRRMIGFNSRSLVLADSNNYKAFLNRYSFVGYNRTWADPGSLIINSLVMRNYKLDMKNGSDYFKLRPDQFKLSDIQKDSIKNAILNSGQMLAGTTYNITDVELCKYALFIYIKLQNESTADRELVRTKIRRFVGEFFGDVQSDSYVPKSDIINLIKNNIPEVDGITCYFLSERNETALQTRSYIDKQYLYDPTTGTYKTKEVCVRLHPNENPMLGLDAHGNILIDSDWQFPVLMGGWDWINEKGDEVDVVDPLVIAFE